MRVNGLQLVNYTTHRDLKISFSDGLIGIIGENGSGKTNMVSSIFELITADFRKKKNRMITYGERKGSGLVDLTLNDSRRITLYRNLHDSDCRLEIFEPSGEPADGSPLTSADSVAAAMSTIFPYPSTVLKGVVFTPQENITSLLFDPKSSVRERMAMSFFGVEKAEEVEARVAEVLSDIPIPSPPHGYVPSQKISEDLIPNAEASKLECENHLEAAIATRDLLHKKVEEIERDEASHAREWIKNNEATQWESSTLGKISTLEDQLADLEVEREQKLEMLAGIDLDDLSQRVKASKEHERLEAEETAAVEAWDKILKSKDDIPDEDIARAREELSEAAEARQRAAIAISSLDDLTKSRKMLLEGDDSSECFTCLRAGLTKADLDRIAGAVDSAADDEASAKRRLQEAKVRFEDAQSSLRALENRKARRDQEREAAFERLGQAGQKSVTSREQIIARWGSVKSYGKLADVLKIGLDTQSELSAIESSIQNTKRRIKALEGELEEARAAGKGGISKMFASPKDAMDVLEKLERAKNKLSEAREWIPDARAELSSATQKLERLHWLLDAATKFERDLAKAEEERRIVSAVRAVFHYSAAPKKVVSARLRAVSKRINSYLEAFEARFTVDAREGFDFDCVFGGRALGKVMSPQDLSGGEKVTLSVAFRLAAAETFCSDVGFLVLDEPTVWMDKKRIENIPRVMEKLSRLAKERGLQYFVVTHDTRLMGCFDQTIELEYDEK